MISTEEDRKLACIDIAEQNKQRKQLQEKEVKFIAYVNQTDRGCDYTIACGKILWELGAETKEEALLELKQKITPPLEDDEGIYELEFVVLYQISNEISVPIDEWYSERVEISRCGNPPICSAEPTKAIEGHDFDNHERALCGKRSTWPLIAR